jgi:hypothetical protein
VQRATKLLRQFVASPMGVGIVGLKRGQRVLHQRQARLARRNAVVQRTQVLHAQAGGVQR